MAKRPSLKANIKAPETDAILDQFAALSSARSGKAAPAAAPAEAEEMTTTAIHIPKTTLTLLRRVAVERAITKGGRPSVSAVLAELVEANRAELEKELA